VQLVPVRLLEHGLGGALVPGEEQRRVDAVIREQPQQARRLGVG